MKTDENLVALLPGRWSGGPTPPNVTLGPDTLLLGDQAFKRFCSKEENALVIGAHCSMDGVQFNLGAGARMSIGDYCCFAPAVLLCELEIQIGSRVLIGWNATIMDADFSPMAPAERIADAIATSVVGGLRPRPLILKKPVVIEDDVWIGPNVTVLRGVRIGTGAHIEAGAVVGCNVPPRSRFAGNPAQIVGQTG